VLTVALAMLAAVQAPAAAASKSARPGFCEPGTVNEVLWEECRLLLRAKKSLDPDGVLNWSRERKVKRWAGVELSDDGVHIVGLDLSHRALTGRLSPLLGRLVFLEEIDMGHNELTGSIPPELGNLAALRRLNLNHNRLGGKIPPELGRLNNLEKLELAGNNLRGKIPNALENLKNLQRFILRDNQLTGNIPNWLSDFPELRFVWLTNNQFTGKLPPDLGSLPSLQYLRVQNNQLTGKIPDSYAHREWRCLLLAGNNLDDTCLPRTLKGKVKTQDMRACPKPKKGAASHGRT